VAHKGIELVGWAANYRNVSWNKLRKPSYLDQVGTYLYLSFRKAITYSYLSVKENIICVRK
jgi:hypothetical protein